MHHLQIPIVAFYIFAVLISIKFNAGAQDIILLERPGTVKNVKYITGNYIKISVFKRDSIIKGRITSINDSDIVLNGQFTVRIKDIYSVFKLRKFYRLTEEIFFKAGVPYFILSLTNRSIKNETPVIDSETAIISGSLVIAGIGSAILKYRTCRVDNIRWRIKILKR